ncbi:ribosome biogenesis protein tsr1 [Russula earlei]|uniref:Ribosome biogenesis protein tsr1 n=1 Tax=Russula earlei TaxID=71964 RepID=A0ACC0UHC4_9AGAM|nr:ribosome biogenesis protein tsr1 [Russula earlei]
MSESFHHRPTLKQTNKPFKSRHATKASLKERSKGRVSRPAAKIVHASRAKAGAQAKVNRRNHAKQIQLQKRQSLLSAVRVFGGVDGAPRVVAVVPLCEDADSRAAVSALSKSLELPTQADQESVRKIKVERFKTSLQFVQLAYADFYATLDACKVADYVVFVLSPAVEVGAWGETILRTLQAQGLPDVVSVVASGHNIDPKARSGILKSLLSFMQYFFPEQSRVFDLNALSDQLSIVRVLSEGKPRDVRWRQGRSWLLAESVDWADGDLALTGVVRGTKLSPNRLVHLPNHGDFQVLKITSSPVGNAGSMTGEPTVLADPDPEDADSLVSTNDPDDMQNEQTWPTEEDMPGDPFRHPAEDAQLPDANPGTTPRAVRRVQKGTSEYQAAWIIDEDNEEDEGEQDDDEDAQNGSVEEPAEAPGHLEDEMEVETHNEEGVTFQDLGDEEENEQSVGFVLLRFVSHSAQRLESWRGRQREERDDREFPDEVDTPKDVPARIRFQRYRGLRSFRTSPWDPYENLPRDYARIFQFEDFKRTERAVRRRSEEEVGAIPVGTRVTVHLKGVPRDAAKWNTTRPLVAFSLLQHEHKKSVVHFAVQRNTEYGDSVRSKDPLILCVGPRRLLVKPVYSQYTQGGARGANNVHKFERYLRHGDTYVATIYGPILLGNQPCALLRETTNANAPSLVAMGSQLNADPTRINAKRIILSGHPLKIHKKTATIRYMFFNPEDVLYYKPIQLYTKYGRMGHIRESLGTHGYFKAHFDAPITQMDTVCMSLYKRVYPKWSELFVEEEGPDDSRISDAMEE